MQWYQFKQSLMQAAHASLPKKHVSPYIHRDKSASDDLRHLQLQTSLLNRIYHTLHQFIYEVTPHSSKAFHLQSLWHSDKLGIRSRRSCLLEIASQYRNSLDPDILTDRSVPRFLSLNPGAKDELIILLQNINSLRKLSCSKRSLLEDQHKAAMIKSYADARCTNFAENKAAFIASSLSRTRRCIVLNRVMHTDSTGHTTLVTDPTKIKDIANLHFQTIAGSPPSHRTTLQDMSPLWRNLYSPLSHVDPNIYVSLLAPPSNDEWRSTISSLPNGKASGPSNISYEMLKHLSPLLNDLLKEIVTLCFESGHIPSQWKDA